MEEKIIAFNIGGELQKMITGLSIFKNILNNVTKDVSKMGRAFEDLFDPNRRGRFFRRQQQETFISKSGKKVKLPKFTKAGDPVFEHFFEKAKINPLTGKPLLKRISAKKFEAQPDDKFESPFKGSKAGQLLSLPFKGLTKIGSAAKLAFKPLDMLGTGVLRLAGVPKSKMKSVKSAIGSFAGMALKGSAIGMVVGLAMQLIDAMNPFKELFSSLTEIFSIYGEILSESFTPLIETLFDVMLSDAVMASFEEIAFAFGEIIVALLPLIDIMAPFMGLFLGAFVVGIKVLAEVIKIAMIPIKEIAPLFLWLAELFDGLFAILGESLGPVLEWVFGLFELLWGTISAIFIGIWDFITGAKGIGDIFKDIGNAFISFINYIIEAVEAIDVFDIINLTPLPLLATGGITKGPSIAGESGPEAVIPLERLHEFTGGNNDEGNTLLREQNELLREVIIAIGSGGRNF